MNMTDEKNPGQESVKADSSDDESIIDLTDEVMVKTEDDSGNLELTEKLADDPQQAFHQMHATNGGLVCFRIADNE